MACSSVTSETRSKDSLPSLVSQHEVDNEKARQEEEWRSELFQLENEMQTLRSVLVAKIEEAERIKRKLGITPLVEFKEDMKHGYQTFKESDPVKKTSAAIKDFGDFASKKLENLRNSDAFKSLEEKVGGAYTSVKKQISSSKSEDNEHSETESAKPAEPAARP